MSQERKERSSVTCRQLQTPTRALTPSPGWAERCPSSLGSDGDRKCGRSLFTKHLSSSFFKRKTGRREAPKADPVRPQSSGRRTQGSSGGGVSCALPTPGPRWPPPPVLPEAEGAPPSGVSPRGLSTLCRSTDDKRNRTRPVRTLVIYRKREGAVLALRVSKRDVPLWLLRPFGKPALMGRGRPATAPPCP